MLRAILRPVLGWILHLFFRRIEVTAGERVPAAGPVVFAINHPNGLVDPLFLLALAPRPVSFLGKAPLFRMPLIGWFVRALDSIPVDRRQDPGTDMARNRQTFDRARALLERGGTIAIFPEGVSHSDPGLKPLKSGAARIALGAGTDQPVALVPTGLFYTSKSVFRSSALVVYGTPIMVSPAPVDDRGEPPANRVMSVTATLDAALRGLVLQADAHAALDLAARAERVLAPGNPEAAASLAEGFALRQRLLAGYRTLRERAPDELAHLTRRVEQLDLAFASAGVDPRDAGPRPFRLSRIAGALVRFLGWSLVYLPLAVPGVMLHYPAYRMVGALADRYAGPNQDALATAKIVGAVVLFPLTWTIAGLAAGWWRGWPTGLVAAAIAPLAGYAALRLFERVGRFRSTARALGVFLFERERFRRLAAERDRLRADVAALARREGV